jgi:hypothetical protein
MKAQLAWKVVDEFEKVLFKTFDWLFSLSSPISFSLFDKDLIKINEIVGQCREGKASVERELQEVEVF